MLLQEEDKYCALEKYAETGQKNNPINLSKNRLKLILSERL
jgi:hypothetical protein